MYGGEYVYISEFRSLDDYGSFYNGRIRCKTNISNRFFSISLLKFSRFDLTHYSYSVKILFIVFMILTPILLLNMLIASMGNTYQRIITISEKERIRQVIDQVVFFD